MRQFLRRFIRSIWFFPSVLLFVILILTIFKVSGSSIGTYQQIFYGATANNPSILAGHPRPIRSDEWLVSTQLTIAQNSNDFKQVNQNIGYGADMSLLADLPYKDWSAFFKPHNWAFFILPFDNAFAFKWWMMGYLLIVSCYFFVLSLQKKRKLVAALISLTLFFSPFVQWWYLYSTLGSLAWSLFACTIFIKLLDAKSRRQTIIWATLLSYALTCFALILYPPFQIPCALAVISFGVGYFYNFARHSKRQLVVEKVLVLGVSAIIVVALSGAFLLTRNSVIHSVQNTAYPGERNIISGEYSASVRIDFGMLRIFSAPLSFGLQDDNRGANYYSNQSEAAAFTLINLIVTPFVLLSIYKKPASRRSESDYIFITTSALLAIFILRIFTPFFNLPFKALLLHQVQNERLEIGLMLLCIIQLAILGIMKLNLSKKTAALAGIIGLVFFANASIVMAKRYPLFAPSKLSMAIAIAIAIVGVTIFMILRKRLYIYGIALFMLFNFASTYRVNPLYKSVQAGSLNSVIASVREYPDNKRWGVIDNILIENIPQMAGKPAFTGVHTYPQLELWQAIDVGIPETNEYNRYAHIIFTTQNFPDGEQFNNPQQDVLFVHFTCDTAKRLPNFGHLMSASPIDTVLFDCLKLDKSIEFPNYRLYLYDYAL